MTRPMKKTNFRMTSEQYVRIAAAARRLGLSTNRYILTACLSYDEDSDHAVRLAALIDGRLQEQTGTIAGAMAQQIKAVDDALRGRYSELVSQIKSAFVQVRNAAKAANDEGTK